MATVARSQPESRAPKRRIPSPKAVSFPSDVEMREASSPKARVEAVASAVAHELAAQCSVSTVPPATSDDDLAPIEGPVETCGCLGEQFGGTPPVPPGATAASLGAGRWWGGTKTFTPTYY